MATPNPVADDFIHTSRSESNKQSDVPENNNFKEVIIPKGAMKTKANNDDIK